MTKKLKKPVIILIGTEKGGSMKSTVVCNVATEAAKLYETIIIDADEQATTSSWTAVRSANPNVQRVPCVQKRGKGLRDVALHFKEKYEVIFIECGGQNSPELRTALTVADLHYMPVVPSQFDVWTYDKMNGLIHDAQVFNPNLRKGRVIITRLHPNASKSDAEIAEEAVNEFDFLELSGVRICERQIYKKLAETGLTVQEIRPKNPKAISEMDSLFNHIFNDL